MSLCTTLFTNSDVAGVCAKAEAATVAPTAPNRSAIFISVLREGGHCGPRCQTNPLLPITVPVRGLMMRNMSRDGRRCRRCEVKHSQELDWGLFDRRPAFTERTAGPG